MAPYSLRTLPEAPVAAPLDWDEALSTQFDPWRITIENISRRLGQRSDPWEDPATPSMTIAEADTALSEM